MDYKWYHLYSYWVAILACLYKLKIIKTNVYPSVLLSIIVTFYIIHLRLKNDIETSTSYLVGIIGSHLLFLLLIKFTFNFNDLMANLLLFICYVIFIKAATGKNVYDVYLDLVYRDRGATFYEFIKRQF